MNLSLRITASGLALAVGLGLGLGACSSTGKATTGTSAGITNGITIKDFKFTPQDLTVKVGSAVTWTNNDSFNHQIGIRDGALTNPIGQGGQTTLGFDTAGKFDYFCNIHNSMTGTVTVTG